MSLSQKSDAEISGLLADYGIKHGPVVGTTRKLYEKKLEKAMKEAPSSSSDKTYYREEEEEVTYITYHSPTRNEGSANMLKQRIGAEPDEDEESDQDTEPPVQITHRAANHSAVRSKQPIAKKSGGSVGKAFKVLLLLAVLAAVVYYAFNQVMDDGGSPFGVQ
ncbi:emerin (Emery-Dreifuss muscular dystrophy) [Embiotoca jacksoni]|uniref:emerin (Emery-Dreifuss muscular dystrophy) n=1 Tax=Embiotoca jacksoni TaxID=100190 RepID=UPI0037039ECD